MLLAVYVLILECVLLVVAGKALLITQAHLLTHLSMVVVVYALLITQTYLLTHLVTYLPTDLLA